MGDEKKDLQQIEDALNKYFVDRKDDGSEAPASLVHMGQAYVRGDLVQELLNATFLTRQRQDARSRELNRREASISRREKDRNSIEEEKEEIRQKLETTTDELYATKEKLRQYEGSPYSSDDFGRKDEGTEMQKAVVDASKTINEYEDQIRQRDAEIERMSDRIVELEAEVERLMRLNADS